MSSLARQLASVASLDADRLGASAKASSAQPSYLFTPTEAAQHDLETIHALGLNGFEELVDIDPSLAAYEDELFSEASKRKDRMVLPKDENETLGLELDAFLWRLGRHIPTRAAAKVIEWLVRRFRIHEMNVEAVLSGFLPYHDSPQFVRILNILKIPVNSHLSFLTACKKAHLPLSRHHLLASLAKDQSLNLLRLVASLLPKAIEADCVHRTLINFHTSTLVGYLEHGGSTRRIGDAELAILVPAVVEGLKGEGDTTAANYIVLLALCRKATFTPEATRAIVLSVLPTETTDDETDASQLISTILGLLQSQERVEIVGSDIAERISNVPDAGRLMAQASSKFEFSKALDPIVRSLSENLTSSAASVLHSFITTPEANPPTAVVHLLVRSLLKAAEGESEAEALKLLAVVKARFADVWKAETQDFVRAPGTDEGQTTTALEKIISAVSQTTGDLDANMFLNANSADASSRLLGVKSIFERLVKGDDEMEVDQAEDVDFRSSASSTLLARVSDPSIDIVQTLYHSPSLLFASVPSAELLKAISSTVHDATTPKANLLRHLEFLAGPFAARHPELAEQIVRDAFFGVLLVTKPRQILAEDAWKVLAQSSLGELVTDLPDEVVAKLADKTEEGKHARQAEVNTLVASKIADNVVKSASASSHIDFFLGQLAAADAHSRILAHLILAALIKNAGSVDVAIRVVEKLRSIPGAFSSLDVVVDGQAEQIVVKPNSAKTTQRVRGALLLTLQSIKPSSSSAIVWLDGSVRSPTDAQYSQLCYLIYGIVNSAHVPPDLSTPLLRTLFANLRDYALAFLASVWTWTASAAHEETISEELKTAALRHAEAFLRAHVKPAGIEMADFQTIVPALLVACGSATLAAREAALNCLKLVSETLNDKPVTPYLLETLYGDASERIQILKATDVRQYIGILLEDRASILIDPTHIIVLHQQHLALVKGEDKKEAAFKRSVLCFLLSHVSGWNLPSARVALLQIARPIRAAVRIEILHPVLVRLFKTNSGSEEESKKLLELLFDSYDRSSLATFGENPATWSSFKEALTYDSRTAPGRAVRLAALNQLEQVFFRVLSFEQKVELIELLVRHITSEDTVEVADVKACLRGLAISSSLMVAVLSQLRSSAEVPRGTKRTKQDSAIHAKALLAFHRGLVIVIEARSLDTLQGDANLLAALLDILASLLENRFKSDINVDYAEQLLLTALCAVSAKVDTIAESETVDVNTVVKVISDCRNPQTFHQGLLLISNLARLKPALVLQNVLPIFISVGANAVQRDDAYTFRVVEKTIDSIIPAMVRRGREQAQDRLQLWRQSRELLVVFADMAQHLPAHRKTRLFSHLIEALGPADFLGPMLLLLLDKSAAKSKLKTADPLALPLSILNSFSGAARFEALNDVAAEVVRLAEKLYVSPLTETFLVSPPVADTADIEKLSRRRISLFLTFVDSACSSKASLDAVAVNSSADVSVQTLVGHVLRIQTLAKSQHTQEGALDIIELCQTSLDSATRLLSVKAFIQSLQPMLQGEDTQLRLSAFSLLESRLPSVSAEARKQIAPTMVASVSAALKMLSSDASDEDLVVVLSAIRAVAISGTPTEDAILVQATETLIAQARQGAVSETVLAAIFSVLTVLNRRLGPRLIPLIKPFAGLAVQVVQKGCKDVERKSGYFRENLFPFVLESTGALVASVPNFVGPQLVDILTAILQPALLTPSVVESTKSTQPVQALLNVIAKAVPAKSAFTTVFQLWEKLDKLNASPIAAFFDLLRRVLRTAPREAMKTQLKATFAFFLGAFDLRWTHRASLTPEEVTTVEVKAISAFMEVVVKLDEATFRPLFVRVYDWAAVALADEATPITDGHLVARRTTLFSIMEGLLEKFKSIMTPYMAILVDHATELLQSFASQTSTDARLWSQIMVVLQKSFEYDEGAFWTDEHLTKLLPTLVRQVEVVPSSSDIAAAAPGASALVASTLASFAGATSSPTLLKNLNHATLLHTRAADPAMRVLALECSSAVWRRKGEEMLEHAPATVADFLGECLEDEDGTVERTAREFQGVLEGFVGELGAFLST